ncbi:hypothetical protein BFP75_00265 [Maribacter sp. 4G9]|nr:hypothetical protein BFP75_00265 [Maribacter sp. 4G9]
MKYQQYFNRFIGLESDTQKESKRLQKETIFILLPKTKRKDLTDCNLVKNAKAVLCQQCLTTLQEKAIPPLVHTTFKSLFLNKRRNGVFIYIRIRK